MGTVEEIVAVPERETVSRVMIAPFRLWINKKRPQDTLLHERIRVRHHVQNVGVVPRAPGTDAEHASTIKPGLLKKSALLPLTTEPVHFEWWGSVLMQLARRRYPVPHRTRRTRA